MKNTLGAEGDDLEEIGFKQQEEQDLDLDNLTQEDKFFLIQ